MFAPAFAPEDKREAMVAEIFDSVIPNFLKIVEPLCEKNGKYLFGNKLTIADFVVGGLFTNFIENPKVMYGK